MEFWGGGMWGNDVSSLKNISILLFILFKYLVVVIVISVNKNSPCMTTIFFSNQSTAFNLKRSL